MDKEGPRNQGKRSPEWAKSAPDWAKSTPDWAESAPDWAKRARNGQRGALHRADRSQWGSAIDVILLDKTY